MRSFLALAFLAAAAALPAQAQNAPTRQELAVYAGLHEAAAKGDVAEIERLIKDGEKPNLQDSKSRTPLHVALSGADHAGSYVFLASDRARGITGTVVHSDGGVGIR